MTRGRMGLVLSMLAASAACTHLPSERALPDKSPQFSVRHEMIPLQSTWFPVNDRNPQKFVPNIFLWPVQPVGRRARATFLHPDFAIGVEGNRGGWVSLAKGTELPQHHLIPLVRGGDFLVWHCDECSLHSPDVSGRKTPIAPLEV